MTISREDDESKMQVEIEKNLAHFSALAAEGKLSDLAIIATTKSGSLDYTVTASNFFALFTVISQVASKMLTFIFQNETSFPLGKNKNAN